jgi:hypothetical protein
MVFPYLTHASCFSSVVVMLWAHGCTILPSLRFEVPNSGAPLLVRVALLARGNRSFVALGLPHRISCIVYEQSSFHLFLWYKL